MATEDNPSLMNVGGYKVPLPPDIYVNDIQIDGDIAYFCGENTSEGVYGWLDLHDLLYANPSVNIYHYSIADVRKFLKMVAYTDTSNRKKVEMVGWQYDPSTSYITYSVYDVTNATSISPTVFLGNLFDEDIYHCEGIYDLVLTREFVVFVGFHYGAGYGLYLRVADRDDVPNTFGNCYVYPYSVTEANGGMRATVVDSSKSIAIAYVHSEDSHVHTTRVRVIDIQSSYDVIHSQEFAIDEKYPPYEIVYDSVKQILIVLQNPLYTSSESRFYLLNPFPQSSYSIPYFYYPNIEFKSLHPFYVKHYLSTGISKDLKHKYWYVQDLSFPVGTGTTCPYQDKLKSILLPNAVPFSASYLRLISDVPLSQLTEVLGNIFLAPIVQCNQPY